MVSTGDRVVVHYVARIADEDAGDDGRGAVVDTTDVDVALSEDTYWGRRDFEPMVFEVGASDVLPAIEDAVREMERGETQEVVVDPEDAYGPRRDDRVVQVPRADLEERSDVTASEGELVVSDDGQSGWITAVSEDVVEVDFNHELADERIAFEIRLLDVEPKEEA